jgi:hypothetical protein
MGKISRNAPCPCGSGKKFKKCCLQKEIEDQQPNKTYHDHCLELVESLRPKILQFMKRSGCDQYINEAFSEYWRTLEPGLDPPEMESISYLQFLEWYIHDYLIPGHDRPVINLFWESSPKLSAEEMHVLQDWQDAYLSVFQVKEVEPRKGILTEDIFSNEEVYFSDVSLSNQTKKWELITFRKVRVLDEWQASAAGSKEHPKYKEDIRRFVMDQFFEHKKQNPGDDLPRFLRKKGYLLNQRFLTLQSMPPQIPKVVTSSGEELAFWEARYDLMDFLGALDRLEEKENFEETLSNKDSQGNPLKMVYDWLERGKSINNIKDIKPKDGLTFKSFFTQGPGQESFRLLGTITLEPGRLVLEAQGQERLAIGKGIIEDVLSGLVRHRIDAVRSLESIIRGRPKGKEEKPEEEIPLEVRQALLKDMYDNHYREWLDASLPALGGKTPRKAIKTKEGRRQVEDLLRVMEYLHQESDIEYDVTWIREDLKL